MSNDRRHEIQELLDKAGGLNEGVASEVARATGVPEAEVYGVGSFYHLIARPDAKIRVCTGLSCRMQGADDVLKAAELNGLPVEGCTCLAGCDVAPAVLRDRRVLPSVSIEDIHEARGDWQQVRSAANPDNEVWFGAVGPERDDPENLVLNLLGEPDWSGAAFKRAIEMALMYRAEGRRPALLMGTQAMNAFLPHLQGGVGTWKCHFEEKNIGNRASEQVSIRSGGVFQAAKLQ